MRQFENRDSDSVWVQASSATGEKQKAIRNRELWGGIWRCLGVLDPQSWVISLNDSFLQHCLSWLWPIVSGLQQTDVSWVALTGHLNRKSSLASKQKFIGAALMLITNINIMKASAFTEYFICVANSVFNAFSQRNRISRTAKCYNPLDTHLTFLRLNPSISLCTFVKCIPLKNIFKSHFTFL